MGDWDIWTLGRAMEPYWVIPGHTETETHTQRQRDTQRHTHSQKESQNSTRVIHALPSRKAEVRGQVRGAGQRGRKVPWVTCIRLRIWFGTLGMGPGPSEEG